MSQLTDRRTLVVISFFEERSNEPLQNLLGSMARHAAGAAYDICLVVNQVTDPKVDPGPLPPGARILKRENRGMNIGAWDHGWRMSPDYDEYLFLQDDCLILRDGWIAAFRKRARNQRIGLLGESLNHAWDKPWARLRDEQRHVDMPEHDIEGRRSNRVDAYLRFLSEHSIEPGKGGRHLRSLVWYASRATLERINGFPIGATYGECIAAEIAVSKMIEASGLKVEQVHRTPFRYVGHTEWFHRARGNVQKRTPTSYAGELNLHVEILKKMLIYWPQNGPPQFLSAKLLQQRRMIAEGWAPDSRAVPVTLVLDLRSSTSNDACMETVRSWFLQSHPQCDCVAITGDSQTALFGGLGGRVRLARTGEWNALGIAPSNYVVFAQPGDLLHPSLAFVIALKTQEQSTTVLVWNSVMIDANCNSVFVQRPDCQRLTLLNHDYIGQDLAVRADYAAEFALRNGGSLKSLFARNFKTWLAWHPEARWTIQPEFLAVRRQADDSAISDEKQIPPEPPANFLFEPREFAGKNIILWPARKPSTISVVIPFRDKPEITLRALRSIERQRFTGQIDVVLVDNESDQEVRDGIETELKTMSFGSTARVLDYRYPFNHSRQCNIGARAARGEVLVFMNNDCELMEDNVLDGLARWALLDGVASVGCRLVAPSGDLISAGIVARSEYGANDSPVEESRESQLSELVREVTGNTFALSAVRRDTFFALGALDELLFPAGYNDVDYCLRAIERRYSHVYLGPLTAAHQPGTSRGKSDERLQRIAIRERHSSVLYRSLVEWRIRKVAAKPERRSLVRTISGVGRTIRRHIGS